MAEPTTTVFQTTLLILYFITTPQHFAPGESKVDQEKQATWTLQATSQIPAENPYMCTLMAKRMLQEFSEVNTSTIRVYCLCPQGDSDKECFDAAKYGNMVTAFKNDSKNKRPGPAVQRIGPKTALPTPPPLQP